MKSIICIQMCSWEKKSRTISYSQDDFIHLLSFKMENIIIHKFFFFNLITATSSNNFNFLYCNFWILMRATVMIAVSVSV